MNVFRDSTVSFKKTKRKANDDLAISEKASKRTRLTASISLVIHIFFVLICLNKSMRIRNLIVTKKTMIIRVEH